MSDDFRGDKKIKEGFIGQKMIVLPPNIKKLVVKNGLTCPLHLTAIGFYPNASYHDRTRKTGSGQYILIYCISGRGKVEIKDQHTELSPNTYVIIPRNTAHHYKSSVNDPWTIYWVHFTGNFADLLYDRYMLRKMNMNSIPFSEKRINTFENIFQLLENRFDEKALEVISFKLLDFISSFIYNEELDPGEYQIDAVEKSIIYMKENLNNVCTAEQFALQQNLSLSHYSRLFRAKTGNSPLHYFNQLKVQKSCQYLYFSERSVKEICKELGFDDPFYFSRLFKKFMGMSPTHYKNRNKLKFS